MFLVPDTCPAFEGTKQLSRKCKMKSASLNGNKLIIVIYLRFYLNVDACVVESKLLATATKTDEPNIKERTALAPNV